VPNSHAYFACSVYSGFVHMADDRKLRLMKWQILRPAHEVEAWGMKVFFNTMSYELVQKNIVQERHLNCWQHLEFNVRSITLLTNSSWDNNFDQQLCKMFVFAEIYILFSHMNKGELTIILTQNMDFWHQSHNMKSCFLTTTYGQEFAELQIRIFIFWPHWSEGYQGHLPGYMEDLNHRQAKKHSFLMITWLLIYLLLKTKSLPV